MSPAHIHILLNHYALSNKTYEVCSSCVSRRFYDETVAALKSSDLLNEDGMITDRGNAYVEMLISTPLPLQKFIDPRFNP